VRRPPPVSPAALLAAAFALSACGGGARGVVAAAPVPVAPPAPDPFDPEALMADVRALCADELAGRGSFQPGGVAAAHHVAGELERLGYEVILQPIDDGAVNVIALRRAGPRAILVSAHYDHLGVDADGTVYPGADDNASGVAVLLALARHAAARRYRDTLVFVAFGAEEVGLVGSAAYMVDPAWPLDQTEAVINFDMVGRDFFEAGAAQPAAASVIGLGSHDGARRAVVAAAARAGLTLVIVPARLLEVFGFDDRTDEWWFRRRGVPAIHFSTGMHRDYHRPSDTPDRLVPEQMARVARTAAGLLDDLAGAGDERRPPEPVYDSE
jgi:Zn-dependent M28 family amino/carboxypeptidase